MKTLKSIVFRTLSVAAMLAFTTLAFAQTVSVSKVAKIYQNVKEIEVDAVFADVKVEGSDRADVDFSGELFGTEQDESVTIKNYLDGDVLKISIKNDKFIKWTRNNYKGVLNLQVPKGVRLTVNSASGEVVINNCNGGLKAQTVSGSLAMAKIEGRMEAKSVSGSVDIKEVSNLVGKGHISTVSGDATLENIKGEIAATAISGSVNITNLEGSISVATISGSVSGSNIMLTANSDFNSISGSVKMKLLNPTDALSFNLSSVSGSLQAKDINGRRELEFKKGAILIKGSTVSGDQKYE